MTDPTASPLHGIDKAFVINLDRRPDRLETFYDRLPFPPDGFVERFAAVDGKQLEPSEELRDLFAGNDFGYRRGTLGCALSHYRIWQLVAGAEYPHETTAVFEDDVLWNGRFTRYWNEQVAVFVPRNADLVYLGGIPISKRQVPVFESSGGHVDFDAGRHVERRVNPFFAVPRAGGFCTYSYVIRRAGARLLADRAERHGIRRAIDHWIVAQWEHLKVYVTVPMLCWGVLDHETDVQLDFDRLF